MSLYDLADDAKHTARKVDDTIREAIDLLETVDDMNHMEAVSQLVLDAIQKLEDASNELF